MTYRGGNSPRPVEHPRTPPPSGGGDPASAAVAAAAPETIRTGKESLITQHKHTIEDISQITTTLRGQGHNTREKGQEDIVGDHGGLGKMLCFVFLEKIDGMV